MALTGDYTQTATGSRIFGVSRALIFMAMGAPQAHAKLGSSAPVCRAGSNGRCNTIWYKAVFKGGVYEARKTIWAFRGAEDRRVVSLEGGADVA
jgi:hypothetical protein